MEITPGGEYQEYNSPSEGEGDESSGVEPLSKGARTMNFEDPLWEHVLQASFGEYGGVMCVAIFQGEQKGPSPGLPFLVVPRDVLLTMLIRFMGYEVELPREPGTEGSVRAAPIDLSNQNEPEDKE